MQVTKQHRSSRQKGFIIMVNNYKKLAQAVERHLNPGLCGFFLKVH